MGVTKGAQGGQRQGGMETRFDEIPSIKSRIICGIIIKPPPPLLHLPCWNWWWGVWSWVGPIRWLYIWHLEGIFHWTKWPDKKLVCKQRRLRAIVTKVLLNAVVGEYRGTAVQTEAVTTSSGRIQPVFSSPLTNLPLTSQPHYFSHILILFIFIPGTNVTQLKLNVDQEVCCCRQLRNSKKELVICCISCSYLLNSVKVCDNVTDAHIYRSDPIDTSSPRHWQARGANVDCSECGSFPSPPPPNYYYYIANI